MYLSVKQAAERLGVCTKTIYRLVGSGRLVAYKLTPRCIRITAEDIDKYVKGG